jgi:hypothetical protein
MTFPNKQPLGRSAALRRLAARPQGVASSDPELASWTIDRICNTGNTLVAKGELFKAKLGHKTVRFYADKREAERVLKAAAKTRRLDGPDQGRPAHDQLRTRSAEWQAAEPRITPTTKVTLCPSYQSRFQAVVTPGIFGGNQRGRVVGHG